MRFWASAAAENPPLPNSWAVFITLRSCIWTLCTFCPAGWSAFRERRSSWPPRFLTPTAAGSWTETTPTCYARRLEEADQIIVLAFNRFLCLWRVIRRWWANRGAVRDSSAPGCMEKWVLYQGRTPARIAGYRQIARQYPEKFILIQNPRQLARFLSSGSYSQ